MIRVKKTRLVNPQRKNSRNPAPPLAIVGSLNPQQRRKTVKKRTTRKKTTARRRTVGVTKRSTRPRTVAKRSNPTRRRRNPPRPVAVRRRRKRNPSLKPISLAKSGLFALIGLVATRQLPQLALGSKNTGIFGYLANALSAFGASYIASKLGDKKVGQAVMIGGMLYSVSRVLDEQVSPVGKMLSLAGLGDSRAAGLGDIRRGYFPLPVVVDKSGQPIIPQEIRDAVPAPSPCGNNVVPMPSPATSLKGLRKGVRAAA